MATPSIHDFTGTVLQGDRVLMTPLVADDVGELARIGTDPRIWEWSPFPMESEDGFRGYIEAALRERDEGRSLPFVTRRRSTGEAVGCTRFAEISLGNLRAEIGWTWLAPDYWRTGFNVEAKLLMLTFAFETLGLRRVELKTDERNVRSRTAMESIGATFEGTFRKHIVTQGGGVRNSVYYSILDDEWLRTKERLAARLAKRRDA